MNISIIFSICWIILSMLASNPSMESASYKTILGIFIVASCIFWSMEHICDRNGLIQRMIIKLDHLLVTDSHWLYQTSIVQDTFHLQWRRDRLIRLFILRSHTCPTEISHSILEIIFIHIPDITGWIPSCHRIEIYHWLLFCFLRPAFYIQWRLHLFLSL